MKKYLQNVICDQSIFYIPKLLLKAYRIYYNFKLIYYYLKKKYLLKETFI